MPRTGPQAIAWARTQTKGWGGLCLKFVRTAFDVPSKYATAHEGWTAAQHKHSTSNPGSIPAGVPVWFSPNHVAVSAGGGNILTTDSSAPGPHEASITHWLSISGETLLGWTEDINGVRVHPAPAAYTDIRPLQAAVRGRQDNVSGPDTRKRVHAVHEATEGTFPYGIAYTQAVVGTKVDGHWGPKSKAALTKTVKAAQKAVRVTADGNWGPKTQAAVTHYENTAHQG
jgi:peptidoglycan hydrolase-like protein with peptidoglycan-binding domain